MAQQPPLQSSQPQMGQQPISQQPIGQQSTGQQSMGQPQMSQQPMSQQPMGQTQTGQPQMTQQPIGQQPMGQPQMSQQPMGQGMQQGATFEESLSSEMRIALDDFVDAITVCEWCADQCIGEGSQMAECIRLCRDVADVAALNIQLMGRDSRFGLKFAEPFATIAQACAEECSQHPQAHCQECARVLRQAADSTWQMLGSFGYQPQGGQ